MENLKLSLNQLREPVQKIEDAGIHDYVTKIINAESIEYLQLEIRKSLEYMLKKFLTNSKDLTLKNLTDDALKNSIIDHEIKSIIDALRAKCNPIAHDNSQPNTESKFYYNYEELYIGVITQFKIILTWFSFKYNEIYNKKFYIIGAPKPPFNLLGREIYLNMLSDFYSNRTSHIAIVTGLGEAGKTSLVSYYLKNNQERDLVWMDCVPQTSFENIIFNILSLPISNKERLIELTESSLESAKGKLILLLRLIEAKFTIVLDDVHQTNKAFIQDMLNIFSQLGEGKKLIFISRIWFSEFDLFTTGSL